MDSSYPIVVAELALRKFVSFKSSKLDRHNLKRQLNWLSWRFPLNH